MKKIKKNAAKHTVYTLGKDLSLSPATVSKALSDSDEINAETRERVRAYAQSIGFVKRAFNNRPQCVCAIIVSRPGDATLFSPFVSSLLEGMAKELNRRNLDLSVMDATPDRLNNMDLVRDLHRRGANAAVFINTNDQCKFFRQLDDQRYIYCCALNNDGNQDRPTIGVDNQQVSKLAIAHLASLGHRKLGLLLNAPQGTVSKKRKDSFLQAVSELELPPPLVIAQSENEDNFKFGYRSMIELIKGPNMCSGVYVLSETVAIGAIRGATDQRIDIPNQLSIVACDDFPEADYLCPRLTTVSVPNQKIGSTAAAWVSNWLQNGSRPPVPPEEIGRLIIRESTGNHFKSIN